MKVTFKRTGERRYGVIIALPGGAVQVMNPAPGYDDDIPHDLVHYVVEAELGLTAGVFGRAAQGAGAFVAAAPSVGGARQQARQRRKQKKREEGLARRDAETQRDMLHSERLTALCDLAFRRRRGQKADPLRPAPQPPAPEDEPKIERVVARLERLAPLWRGLDPDGELTLVWPRVYP